MKKNLIIFILFGINYNGFTQNILDSIHPLFRGDLNGDSIRKNYAGFGTGHTIYAKNSKENQIILTAFHSNNLFAQTGLNKNDLLPEQKEFRNEYSHYPVPLFDSNGVIVTANGINRVNVGDYEFRVLKNMKDELISWQPIRLFCNSYTLHHNADGSEQTEMAYLGEFKTTFGNSLTFEIKKRNDTSIIKSISAIWINRPPSVIGVFTNSNMQAFLSVFKQQWKHDAVPRDAATYYGDIASPAVDSMMIKRKEFKPNENSLIFYLNDKVKSKETIEYKLITGKKQSGWKANDFDLNLVWLKSLSPGKYKLQLRYSLQRHNVSEYDFAIEPAWHQTAMFKITSAIFAIGFIGFIVLLVRSRLQKQRLHTEQLQKQQVQTELMSIHSQFNPHFVFNALSSIQALITKNDLKGANKYLSEFSTLLRDSLKNTGKEMVSLLLELKMVDSYLQLEQLRFGFNYTISVDESIDKSAIEIPALLLQPLIENAIKHGIAPLYDKGSLTINFERTVPDMFVTISDNGTGYDTNKIQSGIGLKLTRERIDLLNKMLRDQSIQLSVNSSSKGTIVQLLFKNWLS